MKRTKESGIEGSRKIPPDIGLELGLKKMGRECEWWLQMLLSSIVVIL